MIVQPGEPAFVERPRRPVVSEQLAGGHAAAIGLQLVGGAPGHEIDHLGAAAKEDLVQSGLAFDGEGVVPRRHDDVGLQAAQRVAAELVEFSAGGIGRVQRDAHDLRIVAFDPIDGVVAALGDPVAELQGTGLAGRGIDIAEALCRLGRRRWRLRGGLRLGVGSIGRRGRRRRTAGTARGGAFGVEAARRRTGARGRVGAIAARARAAAVAISPGATPGVGAAFAGAAGVVAARQVVGGVAGFVVWRASAAGWAAFRRAGVSRAIAVAARAFGVGRAIAATRPWRRRVQRVVRRPTPARAGGRIVRRARPAPCAQHRVAGPAQAPHELGLTRGNAAHSAAELARCKRVLPGDDIVDIFREIDPLRPAESGERSLVGDIELGGDPGAGVDGGGAGLRIALPGGHERLVGVGDAAAGIQEPALRLAQQQPRPAHIAGNGAQAGQLLQLIQVAEEIGLLAAGQPLQRGFGNIVSHPAGDRGAAVEAADLTQLFQGAERA